MTYLYKFILGHSVKILSSLEELLEQALKVVC